MQESFGYRFIYPIAWIVGCVTVAILGMAAGFHFLRGLCPFLLGPSHRWEVKSDWTQCLINASLWLVFYAVLSFWQFRRSQRLSR